MAQNEMRAMRGMPLQVRLSDRLGASRTCGSDRFEANDGPLRLATRYFLETRTVVHGLRPEPHGLIVAATGLVYGVCLDQSRAKFLGMGNGSCKECLSDTLAAVFGRDDEADDRPDRLIIDRLHHR